MTVVAVWYEPADNVVWAVSDTRISRPGIAGGSVVSTDSGVKLFALPVVCRILSHDPAIERMPHYSSSLGFAFAGTILTATLVVATLTTLFQNLTSVDTKMPPTVADLAEAARKLSERFSREVLASSNGTMGSFEAAIFGFCPYRSAFEIYHLSPNGLGTMEMSPAGDGTRPNEVLVLGSGRARLFERIAELEKAGRDGVGRTGRIPKLAVESLIETDYPDVGGHLSVGLATRTGFRPCFAATPYEAGQPGAWRNFNGLDLDEFGPVGTCFVGMPGMA